MGKEGVDKLAALMGGTPQGSDPASTFEKGEEEAQEAALLSDTEELLKLAAEKTNGNIFDMQVLIETAAAMIREQIRDSMEDDDGG